MRDLMQSLQTVTDERQHNRILRLSFPNDDGPPATLLVNTLDATEGLSRPFEFTLELLSDDALIHLKDMQGKLLGVELVRKDGTLRHFSGRVFRFGLKKVDGGLAYYEAKLGPWLNYLGLRKDNYLFHGATLYDQTSSIFRDYGVLADWDWQVKTADQPMTDACQFDETDLNYLSRRWAAAGLVYWFEHEAGGHKLILSDDTGEADPIDGDPQVPYQCHGGALEEDGIGDWSPVGANHVEQVTGSHTEDIGEDVVHTVGGAHTETIKRDMTLTVTEGRQDSTVKGDITITSLDGEMTVSSPHKITLVVGGSSITMTPDDITIVGPKIFLNP